MVIKSCHSLSVLIMVIIFYTVLQSSHSLSSMTLCLTISSLGITEATTPVLTPAPSHPGGEENAHPHHPHPSPSPFPVTLSRPAVYA